MGRRDRADGLPAEAYHAQVSIDLVAELVPGSEFQDLRQHLLASADRVNLRKLFEVVDAGGWEAVHA